MRGKKAANLQALGAVIRSKDVMDDEDLAVVHGAYPYALLASLREPV
jgi:hypothetical protein